MRRPDFFLVGAPKCGTTALQSYLTSHPAIFMCHPKEPNYFTDFEYPRFRHVDSLEDYLRLFRGAAQHHLAVGEASASYILFEDSIDRLAEFRPDARILVLLRDPIDMIYSWHGQLVFSYEEPEPDFERAWRLQPERGRGLGLPRYCRDPRVLQYREVARFSTQLERLWARFARQRVMVQLLEDMAHRPDEVYARTLEFLGVPSDGRTDFPRINVAMVPNDGPMLRWAHQAPTPLLRSARKVKALLGLRDVAITPKLRRLVARRRKRPPLSEPFRRELAAELRPEVERLSDLLDRDLGHWAEPVPKPRS